jgi:hypothetical protein
VGHSETERRGPALILAVESVYCDAMTIHSNDRRAKTLEDFPQFIPAAVRRGETSTTGYTEFELVGKFDRVIEEKEGDWFYLLSGGGSTCATLKSLDKETKAAILTCNEKNEPEVVGRSLAYLQSYWRPENVWMVLDPSWGWNKKQFRGIDAVAEEYESKDVSIVDGREIKIWTKLEPVKPGGSTRYYPASDQTSPPSSERRIVASGWDHEHCVLCNAHIDMGGFGYCDSDGEWMCEKCYERYVAQHDLAFVDEL